MKTNCAYCKNKLERRPCLIKKGNCYCDASCQLKFAYNNGLRDNPVQWHAIKQIVMNRELKCISA